jgi:hypothetical protein
MQTSQTSTAQGFVMSGRSHVVWEKYGTMGSNALAHFEWLSANDLTFYPSDIREGLTTEIRREVQEARAAILELEENLFTLVEAGNASYFPQQDHLEYLGVQEYYRKNERLEVEIVVKARQAVQRSWTFLQRANAEGRKYTARKHRRNIRAAVANVRDMYYDQWSGMTDRGYKAVAEFRTWITQLTGSKDWADNL